MVHKARWSYDPEQRRPGVLVSACGHRRHDESLSCWWANVTCDDCWGQALPRQHAERLRRAAQTGA